MSIEDRLRRIVTALPEQASVTLPVVLVKEWLDLEADARPLTRHRPRLDPAW